MLRLRWGLNVGLAVTLEAPGRVEVKEYDEPTLGPREVRLRTLYSGISAGTELTTYRDSNPYLLKRWDGERRLFVDGEVSLIQPGEVVWGTWGHRSTAVVGEDWAAPRRLPPGAAPMVGIFSRIGAIALNAVLDADVHVGEYVAVFGQGVPGLIAGQLARLNGGTVIAVDGIPKRLELAKSLGAAHIIDFTKGSPAEQIKALTDGRGADVCIEISGSYRALHEAIRSTAYNSKVVSSGFYQGEGKGLFLGQEFHHNRINVVSSQIFGVSLALDHRWTVARLERTVMGLASEQKIGLKQLVTHMFRVDEAGEAFRLLDEAPSEAVQVVLEF